MSQIEVDPLIRRGIRLLLSKAPDSLEQLKALADEALVAKQRSSSGKLVRFNCRICVLYNCVIIFVFNFYFSLALQCFSLY